MGEENRKVLSFGPFELSIDSRRLTNGAQTVPLGARALVRRRVNAARAATHDRHAA